MVPVQRQTAVGNQARCVIRVQVHVVNGILVYSPPGQAGSAQWNLWKSVRRLQILAFSCVVCVTAERDR